MEAQQYAVRAFLKAGDLILKEYIEVESGKRNNRLQLQAAIDHAKRILGTLLIAKLDRLSRNAGFIFTLRDSGVDFVCADMPEANTLTIGIFAVLAQHERELISQRTRAALQAKKAQGFQLGSPQNLDQAARQKGLETCGQNASSNKANRQASRLVRMYRKQGYTFQQIADELNGEGYLTRYGKSFRKGTVHYLFKKDCAFATRK